MNLGGKESCAGGAGLAQLRFQRAAQTHQHSHLRRAPHLFGTGEVTRFAGSGAGAASLMHCKPMEFPVRQALTGEGFSRHDSRQK